jgi:hypothetical protein
MPLSGSNLEYFYSPQLGKRVYDQPTGKIVSHFTYMDDGTQKHNPAFLNPESDRELLAMVKDAIKIYPGVTCTGFTYGPLAQPTGPRISFSFANPRTGQTQTTNVDALQFIDDVEASYLAKVLDKVGKLRTNVIGPILASIDWAPPQT